MSANKEVELKLRFFQDELWDKIAYEPVIQDMAIAGSEKNMFLETIYYDTKSNSLKNEGLSYRIRRQGDEWIATVKGDGVTSGGLHDRSEWSFVVDRPEPDIIPFYELPVGERLRKSLGTESLQEILRTRFQRLSIDLQTKEGGLIELAVDKGEIVVGARKAPIKEIELELRKGSVAEVLETAAELAKRFTLIPEGESKYYRGLLLANLTPLEETKPKESFGISPNEEVAVVLNKLLLFNVQEIIAVQEKCIKGSCSKEVIEQYGEKLQQLKALLVFAQSLINKQGNNDILHGVNNLAKEVSCSQREPASVGQKSLESITNGRYVPVIYEFWAWVLKKPWDIKSCRGTIREYAVSWFYSWLATMQNIDVQKVLSSPELTKEFVCGIVEDRYILEEIKAILPKDISELMSIMQKIYEHIEGTNLGFNKEKIYADEDRNQLIFIWELFLAEITQI